MFNKFKQERLHLRFVATEKRIKAKKIKLQFRTLQQKRTRLSYNAIESHAARKSSYVCRLACSQTSMFWRKN